MIRLYLAACTKETEHEIGKKLAEYALENAFGIRSSLRHDSRGKPYFDAHGVFVSISHSDGLCLAAVSDKELGADIERINGGDRLTRLAQRFFTEEEADAVKTGGEDRFYEIWCAKESYIKYTGEGFSRPLGSFSVLNSEMKYSYFRYGNYMIAVCSDEQVQLPIELIDIQQ